MYYKQKQFNIFYYSGEMIWGRIYVSIKHLKNPKDVEVFVFSGQGLMSEKFSSYLK